MQFFFLARVLRKAARGFAAAAMRKTAAIRGAAGCDGGASLRWRGFAAAASAVQAALFFCVAGVACVANDGKDSAGETGRLTIFSYFLARGFCARAARYFTAAQGFAVAAAGWVYTRMD